MKEETVAQDGDEIENPIKTLSFHDVRAIRREYGRRAQRERAQASTPVRPARRDEARAKKAGRRGRKARARLARHGLLR